MNKSTPTTCTEKTCPIPYNVDFDQIKKSLLEKIPDGQVLRFISSSFDDGIFNTHLLLTDTHLGLPDIFEYRQTLLPQGRRF